MKQHVFAAMMTAGLAWAGALAAQTAGGSAEPTGATLSDRETAEAAAGEAGGAKAEWPAMLDPDAWRVQVQPRVWYVSPAGRIRLPSTGAASGKIRVEAFDLDSPRASAYGEVALKSGPWRISFGGAGYSVERSNTAGSSFQIGSAAVAPGNQLQSSFEYTTAQGSVGYRVYEHDFGAVDGNAGRTVLRLEVMGGARIHDLGVRVARLTPTLVSSSADPFYVEPFGGGRAELQVVRDFTIDLELSAGGLPVEDSVYSFDIAVGFTWRPIDGLGLQIGWRQLYVDLQEGKGANQFEYTGTMAGLFAGVTLRF